MYTIVYFNVFISTATSHH